MSELHNHFDTIYVTPQYSRKVHLYKYCRYIKNRETMIEKPIDAYPRNHIDLCSECDKRYAKWQANRFEQSNSNKCNRCGKKTDNAYYCRECQLVNERRNAQKLLK